MIGTEIAWFKINGKSSLDWNLRVNLGDTFNGGAPGYEIDTVPGRDGDLLFPLDRISNHEITYRCLCKKNVQASLESLRAYLAKNQGYVKLEDCYHPDSYQMGYQVGGLSVSHTRGIYARFDLKFSVDPRRWLHAGLNQESYSGDGEYNQYSSNTSGYKAYPLIEISGSAGTLLIYHGNTYARIKLESIPGRLYIDCQTLNAYDAAGQNRNTLVTYSGDYPFLQPGYNRISPASGMTVKITPRWYTL